MLLSYLGLGKDLTTIGLVWYYFNIIAIAVIIYKILDLAAIRAKNTSNISERESKEDKLFLRFVMSISTLGIAYFFMREYMEEAKELWSFCIDKIMDVING